MRRRGKKAGRLTLLDNKLVIKSQCLRQSRIDTNMDRCIAGTQKQIDTFVVPMTMVLLLKKGKLKLRKQLGVRRERAPFLRFT